MSRQVFVYVGPARPFGLPIRHNAILADSPQIVFPQLSSLFGQHRNLHRLFVPVNRLAEARAALKQPGSPLCLWSEEIKKAMSA